MSTQTTTASWKRRKKRVRKKVSGSPARTARVVKWSMYRSLSITRGELAPGVALMAPGGGGLLHEEHHGRAEVEARELVPELEREIWVTNPRDPA